MPGKGRRVASRQAQLGRRRKRQARGPAEVPPSGPGTAVADAEPVVNEAVPVEAAVQPAEVVREEPQPRQAPQPRGPRSRVAARPERPAAYTHIGAELRRILIVSGVMFAFLIALSFAF